MRAYLYPPSLSLELPSRPSLPELRHLCLCELSFVLELDY
jgi:hypothetical protein